MVNKRTQKMYVFFHFISKLFTDKYQTILCFEIDAKDFMEIPEQERILFLEKQNQPVKIKKLLQHLCSQEDIVCVMNCLII